MFDIFKLISCNHCFYYFSLLKIIYRLCFLINTQSAKFELSLCPMIQPYVHLDTENILKKWSVDIFSDFSLGPLNLVLKAFTTIDYGIEHNSCTGVDCRVFYNQYPMIMANT